MLRGLQAGCSAPVGALAEVVEDVDGSLEISLRAFVSAPDGSTDLRRSITGPIADAEQLGLSLADVLLDDGARQIIADAQERPDRQRPPGASATGGPADRTTDIDAMEREK